MCVAGHVHAYERSWPVYNYKLDPCGPLNIIIGEPAALLSICNMLKAHLRHSQHQYDEPPRMQLTILSMHISLLQEMQAPSGH